MVAVGDLLLWKKRTVRVLVVAAADCLLDMGGNVTTVTHRDLVGAKRLKAGVGPMLRSERRAGGGRARKNRPPDEPVPSPPRRRTLPAPPLSSYKIYVLRLGFGYYKVGLTRNVSRRVRTLTTGAIVRPEVVATWDVEAGRVFGVEAAIKRELRARSTFGTGGSEVFRPRSCRVMVDVVSRTVSTRGGE